MFSYSEQFMHRALELASRGIHKVSPNPMVGCVIVHENKIIGEGYHEVYGGPHAEVMAVNSVTDVELLKQATMYVTLEPCSHHGKTPPCASLIIAKKIPRVVVCNNDPNPLVAGKGIEMLRAAGVAVIENVLPAIGLELNKRFFTFFNQKRPFVLLKWAQTADGFVARENYDSKWISDTYSRMLVHKWRSEEAAIIVGTQTALYDNPSLNNREWSGPSPIRLVLDRQLRLPQNLNIFDGSQPTICFNEVSSSEHGTLKFIKIDFSENIIAQILQFLFEAKIQSVLVEGGSQLLQGFIDAQLWDEARIFISKSQNFGLGIKAPVIPIGNKITTEDLLNDQLVTVKALR